MCGSTYVEAVGVVNSDLSMVAHLLVPFGSELGAYSLPTPPLPSPCVLRGAARVLDTVCCVFVVLGRPGVVQRDGEGDPQPRV